MTDNTPFQLIDVREPKEVELVSLNGVNIPLKDIARHLSTIRKDIPVIVYCKSGTRGATAIQKLQHEGYTNVKNLQGGIIKWIEEIEPGLPRY